MYLVLGLTGTSYVARINRRQGIKTVRAAVGWLYVRLCIANSRCKAGATQNTVRPGVTHMSRGHVVWENKMLTRLI